MNRRRTGRVSMRVDAEPAVHHARPDTGGRGVPGPLLVGIVPAVAVFAALSAAPALTRGHPGARLWSGVGMVVFGVAVIVAFGWFARRLTRRNIDALRGAGAPPVRYLDITCGDARRRTADGPFTDWLVGLAVPGTESLIPNGGTRASWYWARISRLRRASGRAVDFDHLVPVREWGSESAFEVRGAKGGADAPRVTVRPEGLRPDFLDLLGGPRTMDYQRLPASIAPRYTIAPWRGDPPGEGRYVCEVWWAQPGDVLHLRGLVRRPDGPGGEDRVELGAGPDEPALLSFRNARDRRAGEVAREQARRMTRDLLLPAMAAVLAVLAITDGLRLL